jgi:DNA-binding transcriptional LysR family regulator
MIALPTPQQLRYLVALAEYEHFGRAASGLRNPRFPPV